MEKSTKPRHFAVDFAKRYRPSKDSYLSAWTALFRINELIDDAKSLKVTFEQAKSRDDRPPSWVYSEVVSYYAVGFVTSLEWHARSRITDLLTFQPSAVKPTDVKALKENAVLEMLTENVTIASIVGAVTSISKLDDYLNVFTRIYLALGLDIDGYEAIKSKRPRSQKPWLDGHDIEALQNLYSFRHDLAHEIGINRVGHPNIRDSWSPDDAIRTGELVRRLVKGVEAPITKHAPAAFPHVLDPKGFSAQHWERLLDDLAGLERKVGKRLRDKEDIKNWKMARKAAAEYIEKELSFIGQGWAFFNRYVDFRGPLKFDVVKSRHSHLLAILEELGDAEEFWGEGEADD